MCEYVSHSTQHTVEQLFLHRSDIKTNDSGGGGSDDDVGSNDNHSNDDVYADDGQTITMTNARIKFKCNENETRALFNAILITF